MKRMLFISAVLVLPMLLAFVVGAQALPQADGDSDEDAEVRAPAAEANTQGESLSTNVDKSGPLGIFADIEAAWQGEKVGKILDHYGRGKVTISIEGAGPSGGTFSKNQSHYLLKDLFNYTITERFEFVEYRNGDGTTTRVYAVAEREYKRNDDGRTFEDKIYVSLHKEGDRWVIAEIKSIR